MRPQLRGPLTRLGDQVGALSAYVVILGMVAFLVAALVLSVIR
jgi:hypothetical protein